MSPNDMQQFLCVSIHDVAPHTWPQCARLMQAVHAVADIPLTLLVVPAYHHHHLSLAETARFDSLLERRLGVGDELALHGYTHLDECSVPAHGWQNFKRHIYTRSEGEFSALGIAEARQRMAWGIEWFEHRKWPLHGFIAPAWLMSAGAWQALDQFSFDYTTTLSRFYALPERQSLLSPSLVYSARNSWGRTVSRQGNSLWSGMLRNAYLARLALHPPDADDPRTIAHFQKLLEKLLVARQAVTKAGFAQAWRHSPNFPDAVVWNRAISDGGMKK